MKNSKGAVFLLICCGIVLGALPVYAKGGADPAAPQTAKPTEILVMSISESDVIPVFEAIIENFNKKNPNIHVTLQEVAGGWDAFDQKMLSLIAAGTPPDVGRISEPQVSRFVSQNQFYDLSDWVKRDINMADYYEAAFEGVKLNGKIYGIPTGIYTENVFYNKKMFDAAGIPYPGTDYKNPWTQEEFFNIARKLTSGSGPGKKFGFYAYTAYTRATPLFFSNGGDTFSADRKTATMDSRPMVDTYKTLQTLIREGISPTPAELKAMPYDQLFMSGRLGMVIIGQWVIRPFTANKDLSFGVAPVPKGSAGARTVSFIDQWSIMAESKHPAEAWEFVKYLIGDESAAYIARNNILGIPVNSKTTKAISAEMFNPLSPAEKQMFFDSIDYSKSLYYGPKNGELGTAFNKTMDLIVLDRIPAEEGMKQINKDWNDILNK